MENLKQIKECSKNKRYDLWMEGRKRNKQEMVYRLEEDFRPQYNQSILEQKEIGAVVCFGYKNMKIRKQAMSLSRD